jgi:hypothetical protein
VGALAPRTSLRQEEEFVGVANARSAESGIAELAPAGWAQADCSVGASAAGWAPAGWVLGDCSVRLWVDDSVRHDSALADYSVGPSAEGWAPAGWVLADYSAQAARDERRCSLDVRPVYSPVAELPPD